MCKTTKPSSEFYTDARYKTGLDSRCKSCVKVHLKGWKEKNHERFREIKRRHYWRNREKILQYHKRRNAQYPERQANRDLKKKYGITLEEKAAKLAAQGNRCACCGSSDPKSPHNSWHTDHDHKTGELRGIVCQPCNHALGVVQDNPEHLRLLIEYLDRYRKAPNVIAA